MMEPMAQYIPNGTPERLLGLGPDNRVTSAPNLARDSPSDLIADATLGSAALPVAAGEIITAGGTRYEVVADPGPTVPKRMIQTAAPVTLKFAGNARMDIAAFGAVEGVSGAARTTKAIDAAMAEAAYWQRGVSDVVGTYPVTADGPAVHVPAGRWYYEGAGLDRTVTTSELIAKSYAIRGEHRGGSIIINKSDCYILKTGDVNSLTFEHFSLIGGKGLWVGQNTGGNVRGGIYANNLLLKNFTDCALGHSADDFPNIHISHCQIEGLVANGLAQALFGLCFPGLTDEVLIHNNSIGGCRYGIKLGKGGNNAKLTSNGLFVRPHQSGLMGADIWIVPRGTEANAGQGLVIDKNKFGPEGIESALPVRILIADEDAANVFSWQRPHSAAKSTGYAVGARISKNGFYGNAQHGDRLIYSTTHRLNGMAFEEDNLLSGFSNLSKIIEYSPEVLADYAAGSLQMRAGGRILRGTQGIITPAKTMRPSNMRGSHVPAMPDFGNGMEGNLDVARGWIGEPDVSDYIPIFAQGSLGTAWVEGIATAGIDDPFGGVNAVRVNPTGGVETRISLPSMRAAILAANVPQGAVGWVECWMRSAGGLAGFAGLVYGSSYDRVVNVSLEGPAWQLVRFPVTLARLAAGTGSPQIRVGIPDVGAINGQAVDFYGARFYVSRSPVSGGHLRLSGANAGAWNGPRVILGGYHLWVDVNGALRKKASAPTGDLDGTLVSADGSSSGGGILLEGSLSPKNDIAATASTPLTLYTLGLPRSLTRCLVSIEVVAWDTTSAALKTTHHVYIRNNSTTPDYVTSIDEAVVSSEVFRHNRPSGPAVTLSASVAATVVGNLAVITYTPGATSQVLRVRAKYEFMTPPADAGVGVTEH